MKREREESTNHFVDITDNGKYLREKSENVEVKLWWACNFGKLAIVKELITKDVDVNMKQRDYPHTTLLQCAAESGNIDIVKVLIQNGADVNAVDENEQSALHHAADYGDVKLAKALLENGADVNAIDEDNLSALHIAAQKGDVDVAKVLIENSADVNAVNNFKESALHCATRDGHIDIAKVLLENGAHVNAVNAEKKTALHLAAHDENRIVDGRVDIVKVLIQNGADVNAVDNFKWGVLHWAAFYEGDFDVVKVLLENGTDINAVTKTKYTALGIAVQKFCICRALQLLCLGAEIDELAIKKDKTELLQPIQDRLKSLRAGNGMKTNLMSNEERRFMWNLAFFFTIQHRVAAFKAYYSIRSFITFHGIFMGPGYDIGDESIWDRKNYPCP